MLRDIISERERELPVSTIGKLIKIAEESRDIISVSAGEPDFDSPRNVIAAAKRFLDMGFTHYSPPKGRTDFIEAILKKVKKENGISAKPENVIVTTGSTEGIFLGLLCSVDPGEGVLIPDPGFLSYKPSVEVLNGMPLSVPLHDYDDFAFNIDRLKEAIVPEKTRVLIINTPSNPTGTVMGRKRLEEIADFVVEYNLLVLADEAYEKLVYDDAKHVSIGGLNGMEDYVLTLHSFSKSYAMSGFRIGYCVGPEELIKAMSKVHILTSLCAPTISQVTAIEALKGPQKSVKDMVKEYDRRRLLVIRRLKEMGLEFVRPRGAFYVFPKISQFGMKSLKFSEKLLKEKKVAVVPGTEFGRRGEGFIRISYATEYKKLEIALDRIGKFVEKL